MKRIKTLLSVAASLCCLTMAAHATLLLPGGSVVPAAQAFGGVAVSPLLLSPYFQDSPAGPPVELQGAVRSQVFVGDAANPFGPGALSFYYRVENIPGGSETLLRFTARGFAGFLTDVRTIPGGVPPTDADRSAGVGNVVGFNFAGIGPGLITSILVIHTDARFFAQNNGTVSDGVVANMPVWAPTPVPEPGTMVAGALLLVPFALSTVRRLRKNRTA